MDIRRIGTVRRIAEDESVLVVDPAYEKALTGIEPGEPLQILYWMHKLTKRDRRVRKAHPRGDRRRRLKGVFGLRSPMRPNPIGVSVVRVRRIEKNRVTVSGLDALDGSPLIDIKGSFSVAKQTLRR